MGIKFITRAKRGAAELRDIGILAAAHINEAREVAPWAMQIEECDGGWLAFATDNDYRTWAQQQ